MGLPPYSTPYQPPYTPPPFSPEPAPAPVDPQEGVPEVRWVKQDWQGIMQDHVTHESDPFVHNVMTSRKFDCLRQIVGAIFCGFLCVPCAVTRSIRHCTHLNPLRVPCGDSELPITGLEMCSAPDCSQVCGGDTRGYANLDYTRSQEHGSGFSRKTLDRFAIVSLFALGLFVTLKVTGVIDKANIA